MPNYRRDASLAVVALVTLLALLAAESALNALWRPVPAAAGVVGALLLELWFLRSGTLARRWERPSVHLGSLVAVVASGIWAYVTAGPPVVATLCWGLLTYFALLGTVVTLGHNPIATE